jgi:hypothetical protein
MPTPGRIPEQTWDITLLFTATEGKRREVDA